MHITRVTKTENARHAELQIAYQEQGLDLALLKKAIAEVRSIRPDQIEDRYGALFVTLVFNEPSHGADDTARSKAVLNIAKRIESKYAALVRKHQHPRQTSAEHRELHRAPASRR